MKMDALIDAGVHIGFPRRLAEEIVLQTVSGSVDFARPSGKHMAELRNMVTSLFEHERITTSQVHMA